ncbi:hypothetical protein AS9A_1237 [Hoyosella subflava DQS3-9A1]|uniref:Uncharacterized protein n=1 Tax=Hoyosella subflava (strain DSM 45089 / JCM 17490 / NBRC 109087 / DQS3-9A1) TaxID=443218 RepID=F6EEJ2_HOYSD|nr:hypothetical protein AS9A_1237 [Hoyosella subflava DQS3-9A1]
MMVTEQDKSHIGRQFDSRLRGIRPWYDVPIGSAFHGW